MPTDWKNERILFPALTLLLSALVLIPFLNSYGFWDPQEIGIADEARNLAAKGLAASFAQAQRTQPPLTPFLLAASVKWLGPSELAVRMPLALLGIFTILITYFMGQRLNGPRAGFFAALTLLAAPLMVFEARQLTSDMASIAMGTLAIFGLIGLAWPENDKLISLGTARDAAASGLGLLLGYYASGLAIGVLVPVLAIFLGLVVTGRRTVTAAILGAATIAAIIALGVVIFDLVPAQAGQRALFGKTLVASKGYIALLGGTWTAGGKSGKGTFDYVINQVAFGMFPWSAVAPLAVIGLVTAKQEGHRRFGKLLVLFWCLTAYVVATLWVRKVGELRFFALPAIALAIGLFIDEAISAPRRPLVGLPLAAFFVLAAGIQLSRDAAKFPEELAAVHLLASIKVPREPRLMAFVFAFGLLFSGTAFVGLLAAHREEGRWRYGLQAAIAVGCLFGGFLSYAFTPQLSEHFSYKNVFQSVLAHQDDGEPLGVMGIPGSGPEYYSRGPFTKLGGRSQLLEFLRRAERVFAIAPASELCAVHQAGGTSALEYHVLDNRNSRFILLSNRLAKNESDENPLLTAMRREPPANIGTPVKAKFDEKIELLGVDMPKRVAHGDRFKMTFYFHLLGKPVTNYKIFVHFDGKGTRFQGDHEPIQGRCGTTYWQAGDYVIDTFPVTAGELTHPRGTYTIYMGFFTGSGGQWKNLPITEGDADKDNRLKLGTLLVR